MKKSFLRVAQSAGWPPVSPGHDPRTDAGCLRRCGSKVQLTKVVRLHTLEMVHAARITNDSNEGHIQ